MTAVTDNVLGLLGLALRSGNLAVGEDPVAAACQSGRAKVVLLASDAAGNTVDRARRLAGERVPLAVLPRDKSQVGFALGRSFCAVLAVTDLGLAAALLKRLVQEDESLRELAGNMEERVGRRKGRRPNRKTARAEEMPADMEV